MDLKKTEQHRAFIINTVYWALILVIAYIAFNYVIVWIMPFLIGLLVALLFRPLIQLVSRKTKIKEKFWAFVFVILGYIILGLLLWLGGYKLLTWLKNLSSNLPAYYNNNISPFLDNLNRAILDFANRLSPDIVGQVGETLRNMADTIQNSIVAFSADILSLLANASTRVPLFLISLIFTILSSLFISMDFDEIAGFVKRQLPDKQRDMLIDIKDYLKKTILSYARAYLILMCITFVELSVGLLALRVENAIPIALLIAIADALPVLGTGTVVLPWAVIALFQQKFYLAAGLLLLYLIVTVVRQFIEPKVVGDQLGLPPIVTIICIYLGFVWFGILGAIAFPITMNIIVALQRAEKIHLWK